MNDYEQRRQDRIDRLRDRVKRKRAESAAQLDRAGKLGDAIPMGQPILVGHHSQRRHERDLDRIQNATRRGVDAAREADDLERRAQAAENSTAISSDDPNALVELRAKVARLEARREDMKRTNREWRRGGWDAVSGLDDDQKTKIKETLARVGRGDGPPFAPYQLTNLGGRIRQAKARIVQMETQRAIPSSESEVGDVRIVDNADANRVQLFLPGRPGPDLKTRLKRSGWRWSPSRGCWQRHRSTAALNQAQALAGAYSD